MAQLDDDFPGLDPLSLFKTTLATPRNYFFWGGADPPAVKHGLYSQLDVLTSKFVRSFSMTWIFVSSCDLLCPSMTTLKCSKCSPNFRSKCWGATPPGAWSLRRSHRPTAASKLHRTALAPPGAALGCARCSAPFEQGALHQLSGAPTQSFDDTMHLDAFSVGR